MDPTKCGAISGPVCVVDNTTSDNAAGSADMCTKDTNEMRSRSNKHQDCHLKDMHATLPLRGHYAMSTVSRRLLPGRNLASEMLISETAMPA